MPTIEHLLEHGRAGRPGSHLGRPEGQAGPELSLRAGGAAWRSCSARVVLADDCVGEAREGRGDSRQGEVRLLENLRFHPGRRRTTPRFARAAGRARRRLRERRLRRRPPRPRLDRGRRRSSCRQSGAGFLMEKRARGPRPSCSTTPSSPFVAVLGGAKVSRQDRRHRQPARSASTRFCIGGAMAYTFLARPGRRRSARAASRRTSSTSPARRSSAARGRGVELLLPVDVVVADALDADAERAGGRRRRDPRRT